MSLINRTSQFAGLENNFLGLQRIFNVSQAVNGGIDFGDSSQQNTGVGNTYTGNMNGQWVEVQAPSTPNTTFTISHDLNRTPSHYHYISDVAARLNGLPGTYGTWTNDAIYLQSDTGSANFRIFVM